MTAGAAFECVALIVTWLTGFAAGLWLATERNGIHAHARRRDAYRRMMRARELEQRKQEEAA